MGQARNRGTREQRAEQAKMAGRAKDGPYAGLKLYKLPPMMQTVIGAVMGPLARAQKREPQP